MGRSRSRVGKSLISGARLVGRSTAFRLYGWGRRKRHGKWRDRLSFPSSLLLLHIEVREAYASGGGTGVVQPSPPPTISASSNKKRYLSW